MKVMILRYNAFSYPAIKDNWGREQCRLWIWILQGHRREEPGKTSVLYLVKRQEAMQTVLGSLKTCRRTMETMKK
jgi:hypothetical protein